MELYTISNELGGHCVRVQIITEILLKHCGNLSPSEATMIAKAAGIHDLGKVKIPDDVLYKPGKLTIDEFAQIKNHPKYGNELIDFVSKYCNRWFFRYAEEITLFHHERIDGGGYPFGLEGSQISREAQLVSIADVFDAMSNNRCYKKAYSYDEAYKLIKEGKCGAFNSDLVNLLGKNIKSIGKEIDKFNKTDTHNEYKIVMNGDTVEIR